ncbi:MAG: hypothetical protein Q8M07_11315 [Prosthecobacter sp.]|nr:hypothetical protein [Prosthecobacter sp.]
MASTCLLFSACQQSSPIPENEFAALLQREGLVAYKPPQGNPDNSMDWRKYGPGTIIRRGTFEYEQSAAAMIGEDGVVQASASNQASDYNLFNQKSVSGFQLDASGGYNINGVSDISAALNLSRDTTMEVTFGKNYRSQPFSTDQLREMVRSKAKLISPETRMNLRQKKSDIIAYVVYTDSLKISFTRKTTDGGSAKINLTDADIAKASLSGKDYKTQDGALIVPGKTFLFYRPLEDPGSLIASHDR